MKVPSVKSNALNELHPNSATFSERAEQVLRDLPDAEERGLDPADDARPLATVSWNEL